MLTLVRLISKNYSTFGLFIKHFWFVQYILLIAFFIFYFYFFPIMIFALFFFYSIFCNVHTALSTAQQLQYQEALQLQQILFFSLSKIFFFPFLFFSFLIHKKRNAATFLSSDCTFYFFSFFIYKQRQHQRIY